MRVKKLSREVALWQDKPFQPNEPIVNKHLARMALRVLPSGRLVLGPRRAGGGRSSD